MRRRRCKISPHEGSKAISFFSWGRELWMKVDINTEDHGWILWVEYLPWYAGLEHGKVRGLGSS
ncbi:hypothetical protein PHLCEN_2v3184 [Hermanssonia centrifuga]|uniref:Uncharacterized protein n=1 Tax=Hermanssonia centrifuga TaxID=98765 RepID=A0A2R6R0Z8_9APHY|nr:hypothetical protein PHLCEN_2v3184 [Hermanssonia centrifuga]